MEQYGIGEIARRAGIAASTIRYYESIRLLPPAPRVSGKRRYGVAILDKIRVIRMGQQVGFSIAEIQTLVHEFPSDTPPSKRWEALAGRKITELDVLAKQIIMMKTMLEQTLNCECATLEDCASDMVDVDADAHFDLC
jgi:MerR family redox-sensitive transcriptional activator SoxR